MAVVALFAALTAIGAFIKIPIPYVPFTLQYLFCALAGVFLGAKLGAYSQLLYVGIGLAGVPVFTEGGGVAYILKPTFGYLIGFIVAAFVIGKITEECRRIHFKNTFFAVLSGLFFVYLFGVIHLYLIYNLYLGDAKTFGWAILYGFILCIGGDLILSAIVAIIATKTVPILRREGFLSNSSIISSKVNINIESEEV
ncbi:biotin transporter BioY [Clostridiaceae bacterium 35-E11]